MRKTVGIIAIGLGISLCQLLSAKTLYVDGSASEPGDGTSEKPFAKIQKGIDGASDGDTLIVTRMAIGW